MIRFRVPSALYYDNLSQQNLGSMVHLTAKSLLILDALCARQNINIESDRNTVLMVGAPFPEIGLKISSLVGQLSHELLCHLLLANDWLLPTAQC